jgi:hypothetical protein
MKVQNSFSMDECLKSENLLISLNIEDNINSSGISENEEHFMK